MFTFSAVPATVLGAGPSDRCSIDSSSCWENRQVSDHLTAEEREVVLGEVTGLA